MLAERVYLQMSSEQSLYDVWNAQLDLKKFHRRGPAAAKVVSPNGHVSI